MRLSTPFSPPSLLKIGGQRRSKRPQSVCRMASAAVRDGTGSKFDVCVVGCGMMGSAAIRHLAQKGLRVLGVGPQEVDRANWHSIDVFGCHYDEGRITRKTDPDPVWGLLAQRSIERYREIEAASGLKFFHEVGHLCVGLRGSATIENRLHNAVNTSLKIQHLDSEKLTTMFPYLHFPGVCEGIWEPNEAGWVSARGQVDAQLSAARKAGATIVHETVESIEKCSTMGYTLHTSLGRELQAERVLVAAGGFTNFRPLLEMGSSKQEGSSQLPRSPQLDLELFTAQVAKLELGGTDLERLQDMPSIIFKGKHYWCYILPPIEHPDGKVYLKLGAGKVDDGKGSGTPETELPGKQVLFSYDELVDWYRSGGSDEQEQHMLDVISEVIPGLSPLSVHSESCATTHTPTGQAFCGLVSEGLGVLTGGNGLAGKSADELGLMGALCISSESGWGHDLPRHLFTPKFKASVLDRKEILARSWSEAAEGYNTYFKELFLPWMIECNQHLAEYLSEDCIGDVCVPACGPGHEIAILSDSFSDKKFTGIDLSPGMISVARRNFSSPSFDGRVKFVVGDATYLPVPTSGDFSAVFSTFGLQQFPDPPAALENWVNSVVSGGVVIVCFWPSDFAQSGPWHTYTTLLKRKLKTENPYSAKWDQWEDRLVEAAEGGGGEVLMDYAKSFECVHDSFEGLWEGMVENGPWRAMKLQRGNEFMLDVKNEMKALFPDLSAPIRHSPSARILVIKKRASKSRM